MDGDRREWVARVLDATERAAARLDPDGQPSHRELHAAIIDLQERLENELRAVDGDAP